MTVVEQLTLFNDSPVVIEPAERLSVGRKRTLRQHDLVAAGFHPLAKTRTVPDAGTCGTCVFRVIFDWHARSYPKCTRFPDRITHSVASDCRAWWPACIYFEEKV